MQLNGASVRLEILRHEIEQCRLSAAVRSDERCDLAFDNVEVQPADHTILPVGKLQPADREEVLAIRHTSSSCHRGAR